MAERISEQSLRAWMERLGPRLIALSAGICRDRHRAEEVVQEAFVKLWRCPPDAGEVAYPSWLRKVVSNLSINALNRTRRPGPLPEYSVDPALGRHEPPDRAASDREHLDRVQQAMDKLDPAKRTILMLRAFEEMSYDEIATHLGVPVGTVMSRLNRARTALASQLEQASQEAERAGVLRFRDYKRA